MELSAMESDTTSAKKMKNETLQSQLPETVPDISIPGINRVFQPEYGTKMKCSWALAIAICVIFCIFQITDRVSYYLENPVYVDVTISQKQTVLFPSVSLCSGKLFRMFTKPSTLTDKDLRQINEQLENNKTAEHLWERFRLRPTKLKTQISCWTSVKHDCYQMEGDSDQVTIQMEQKTIDTVWGRCLILVPKEHVEYHGPFTSLSVEYAHQSVHTKQTKEHKFFLHRYAQDIRHDAFFFADVLTLAHDYTFRVSAKEFSFLNIERNPCIDKTDALRCRNNCIDKKLEESLTCSLPFMKSTLLPMCATFNDIKKAYAGAIQVFGELQGSDCECTRACHDLIFSSIMDDKGPLPEDNLTKLSIYYADNLQEKIEEVFAYSFSALISDIGGSLGLFLGACLLTILEIIEALVKKIAAYARVGRRVEVTVTQ